MINFRNSKNCHEDKKLKVARALGAPPPPPGRIGLIVADRMT